MDAAHDTTGTATDEAAVTALIGVRLAVGVLLLLLARPLARWLLGSGRRAWVVRALGVRDLVVGAGTALDASRRQSWLRASSYSDAFDAVGTALVVRRHSRLGALLGSLSGVATAAVTRVLVARRERTGAA